MAVKNASQASEIVKDFVDKFSALGFVPTCANKKGSKWMVEGRVGFAQMSFEIDGNTGEILNFCESERK